MSPSNLTRPDFLKTSAASAGVLALGALTPDAALGANDRINFGVIGCGGQFEAEVEE